MPKRKKKNKILFRHNSNYWAIIGLYVVLILLLVNHSYSRSIKEFEALSLYSAKNRLAGADKPRKAWVELDYGNGKKRLFLGEFDKKYPFYTVLYAAAQKGTINFSTDKKGKIEKIDKVKSDWRIYHNGQYSGLVLDGMTIGGGDEYVIKRVK